MGADWVSGGAGDDSITTTTSFTGLSGGAGYDRVYLSGTTGNTINLGTAGIESISGGSGNDNFNGSTQTVALSIDGNVGSDTLYGGSADDYLQGGDGNNYLYGNSGNDHLYTGSGSDYLNGGQGNDYMTGGTGNDIYVVDSLGDTVYEASSAGSDTVYAYVDETLATDVENLYLYGSATYGTGNAIGNIVRSYATGSSQLSGLGGNDGVYGYAGSDTLIGGQGNDYLAGSSGADSFVFAESGISNRDAIGDFSHADDTIVLKDILDGANDSTVKGLDFYSTDMLLSNKLFKAAGATGSNLGDDGGIYVNTTNGEIWYNPTDNLAGDSVIICTVGVTTAASLDYTDFYYAA